MGDVQHFLEVISGDMELGFGQKERARFFENRLDLREKESFIRSFMSHPEGQGEINFIVVADVVLIAEQGGDAAGDPCLFGPLHQGVQHLLLQINGNNLAGFANHPGMEMEK